MQQAAKRFLAPTAYYILHTICALRDIVYRKSQIFNFRHFSPGPDLAKPDSAKINQDW
jgi:hypothetical protein